MLLRGNARSKSGRAKHTLIILKFFVVQFLFAPALGLGTLEARLHFCRRHPGRPGLDVNRQAFGTCSSRTRIASTSSASADATAKKDCRRYGARVDPALRRLATGAAAPLKMAVLSGQSSQLPLQRLPDAGLSTG